MGILDDFIDELPDYGFIIDGDIIGAETMNDERKIELLVEIYNTKTLSEIEIMMK